MRTASRPPLAVDPGGRPLVDAGGRLVFLTADGSYVLDPVLTPAVPPVAASGPPVGFYDTALYDQSVYG